VMGGRTVLLVAHRLSTVRTAESIAVLEGGRVAEQGSHDELLAARGAYFKLVRQQMGPAATGMDRASGPQPDESESLLHASAISVSLPDQEVSRTPIVEAPGAAPSAPRPDVHQSRSPSQQEGSQKHEEEKWARVGTWCRALRRNRPGISLLFFINLGPLKK